MAQADGRHEIQAAGEGRKNARLSARVFDGIHPRVEINAFPAERRSRVRVEEEWFLFRHRTAYCFDRVGAMYWLKALKKSSFSFSGVISEALRSDCSDWLAT